MAHYNNTYVVTNPNGTITLKDLQQICSIEGQSVQFVVDDSNGANVLTQPTLVYEDSNEQTLAPTHAVIGTQLDQRQNVYIIKTNDSGIQPTLFNKTVIGTTKISTENKVAKDHLIQCFTQPQAEWAPPKDDSETIELLLDEPNNTRSFVSANVRTPQHLPNTVITAAPNVVVQASGVNQRLPTLVAQKRHSVTGSVTSLLHTTQNKTGAGRGGKMKRLSTGSSVLPGSPNIILAQQKVSSVNSTGTRVVSVARGLRGPVSLDQSKLLQVQQQHQLGPQPHTHQQQQRQPQHHHQRQVQQIPQQQQRQLQQQPQQQNQQQERLLQQQPQLQNQQQERLLQQQPQQQNNQRQLLQQPQQQNQQRQLQQQPQQQNQQRQLQQQPLQQQRQLQQQLLQQPQQQNQLQQQPQQVPRSQQVHARKALSPTANVNLGQLSERIKAQQANLAAKQKHQLANQQQRHQPVLAVIPTPRVAQTSPQRNKARMGQMFNRQQSQAPQHQLQSQSLPSLQARQQHQQQVQQSHHHPMLRQQPHQQPMLQISRQPRATSESGEEQPMEVDELLETCVSMEQSNRIHNSSSKTNVPEDNSSESIAYLQQDISDPANTIVQHQISGNEAKMLVILENGEQRLITFEVPKEDCTVADLLEQANIQPSQHPHVSLVADRALGINYIVDTMKKTLIQREVVNTTVTSSADPPMPIRNNSYQAASVAQPSASPRTPKYITGMLAVCTFCGMSASDFNYCMRCKRKLPEDVKSIPISTSMPTKKDISLPVDTFYKKPETPVTPKPETAAKKARGKPRGGATSRAKQIKEPECLTISSDEEDENRKQKKVGDRQSSVKPQTFVHPEEAEPILEKEPIITNTSITFQKENIVCTSGCDPSVPPTSGMAASLTCRTVRIGSYKYVPSDAVTITSDGLKLDVPLLEDEQKFILIDIKYKDIVKVLIHFQKNMPVLFFYTNVETGLSIRDLLGMQDPKGPYFDPASKDHTHKRITLLPERIEEESKARLKDIFKIKYEELSPKEANDILVKASPKAASSQVQSSCKKPAPVVSNNLPANSQIQTLTVYPAPPAKGGIAINTEDYLCLSEDQFLNDVIIDFYLKYLMLELLSEEDQKRTHVFSSYFYKRLTSPHAHTIPHAENLSPAAKRHARVQKWTKNVNIFDKDFIVIPINEHAHWFLAIICFPGLVGTVKPKVEEKPIEKKVVEKKKKTEKVKSIKVGNTTITAVGTITIDTLDDGSERDEAEGDDDEMETDSDEEEEAETKPSIVPKVEPVQVKAENKEVTKVPCILIFDSLAGASRARVVATLRDYLSCEYQKKLNKDKAFTKDTIKGACPKVPQQSNFTDCGLYVLQYVESFFQTPLTDYTLPIKTLKTWFDEIVVTRKREELANLLIKLVNNTKGTKVINLPSLVFPTQDGILKQKPENQSETKPTVKTEPEKKTEIVESTANVVTTTVSSSNTEVVGNVEPRSSQASEVTHPADTNTLVSSTTDGTITVHREILSTALTKGSADTMLFLKNKRIPRLQKSSDDAEDNQTPKKHKGDSLDSCK